MSDALDPDPKALPWLRIVVGTGAAYGLFYGWALSQTHATQITHYGALGDAFGPLAAFASTVGLIGAIVSVNYQRRELALQRRELKLQRKEMKDSRAELKRTAAAQEAQVKALEAAAKMAEAQRVFLEESAKAARLQAVAAAWSPIGAFLGEVSEIAETLRKWESDFARTHRPSALAMNQVEAIRVPAAPLFLADGEYDAATRIVDELASAKLELLLAWNDNARTNVYLPGGTAEPVERLKRVEALLIGFRLAMSRTLNREVAR